MKLNILTQGVTTMKDNYNDAIQAMLWLLLEYRANNNMLNAQGIATLTLLREKWDIKKADKVFAEFCKEGE